MVYSSWRRSPRKDNSFVVKLVVSVLLLGLAFMLLYNRPSKISPDPLFLENTKISASFPTLLDSQQNADQFPKEDNEADSTKIGAKCDLFSGDWVHSDEEPLYNQSCSFISEYQGCLKNGRPDKDFLYWRWKPRGCPLPRLDPVKFLELMRNKSWAFIGDSISRNHFESFLCTLTTVAKAVLVDSSEDSKSRTMLIPSYNFSASVVWSPFLAKAAMPKDVETSQSATDLHLDILDSNWTARYKAWDYIVFSGGKWFVRNAIYYENNTILGCHNCPKPNSIEQLGPDFAYRKVLRNVLDHVIRSDHMGMVFYRTTTSAHFEDGDWMSGGRCKRRGPAKEGEFELSWFEESTRKIEVEEFEKASKNGVNLRLLDVNPLSMLRPDGHPDVYRYNNPNSIDKNMGKVLSDCLHWCLPGPIDTWNDFLMEMVVNG